MKCIIAGGRDYKPSKKDAETIEQLISIHGITEIVSGGCSGADAFGEHVAKKLNLSLKIFPADWARYGKSAGPIRNKQMAEYAEAIILLPGGNGTASMRAEAIKAGLQFIWEKIS